MERCDGVAIYPFGHFSLECDLGDKLAVGMDDEFDVVGFSEL